MISKKTIHDAICDMDLGTVTEGGMTYPVLPNAVQILNLLESLPEEGYDLNAYQREALRSAPMQNYHEELDMLKNGLMGLCGESGECMDALKKATYQGHELNREKIAEELGDVLWYVAISAQGLGYSLQDIAIMNNQKLARRYPKGFEEDRSVNREKYEGGEAQ